ncbi:MAG: UvrD-helicase domain-containing protein [Chloroflexota bacterium]|nr:UvrD-helicase domain-containing protein [Chloroflexota bacterium]
MTIADQAARERVEQSLNDTLFVEAGAGTGKTEALVRRIVNLIASGDVRANQIAAITFTEKAAAELYDRVLERLDERRLEETDPQLQLRFADAAEQLDNAAIETLHAFAARILRMYPIEAGLPPGFRILDETESSLAFAERWQQALDALLEDKALADHLLYAFDAGVELDDLRQVARRLHEDWDRAQADAARLEANEADAALFIAALGRAIEARHHCSDEKDKLYLRLVQLDPFLQRLQDSLESPGRLARLLIHTTPTSLKVQNAGRKANWPNQVLDEIREVMGSLDQQRDELRGRLALRFSAPIFDQLRMFVGDYAEDRRRRGTLEFQDLLIRARLLLEGNDEVAQAVGNRFQRILVDEFQDNDPLQTRIVDAITKRLPGRAFFVGDPKQSIYRFRRADIRQFNEVKRREQTGLTRLTQNFRSAPGVTQFVNAVFAPLMQAGGPDQAEWEDLNAFRPSPDDASHAVTVVGGAMSGPIAGVRRTEGDALARIIGHVNQESWQIHDQAIDATRDARFADVAVLVATRTGLTHILPALERYGIPYRLESRSLVYDSREVRDLLSILQAIDDPTDQIALLAALKSPGFACADDDLYRWSTARGHWDYRREQPREVARNDPVADSMRWLRATAQRRWQMSVSELVGLIIRERRLMELAVAERQPREHWQRYRFMVDQARAFSDRGGSTLSEFLQWAQHQAEEDTQVIESVVPEEDHDAVRIMTIHAAKGLEFPVVVFAGLNSAPRSDALPLLWHDDGRVEVRWRSGLETPGFLSLRDRERDLERQEYVRRNYVAATRARDYLIISLYRGDSGKSDAQQIDDVLSEAQPQYRRLSYDEIPEYEGSQQSSSTVAQEGALEDRTRWLEDREQAIREWASMPHESATGVARPTIDDGLAPVANPNFEPDDDLPAWRRGRAGTAIGRATHGVLQVIDLNNPREAEIANAARAQAAAESLRRPAADEVERLVKRALESRTVRAAVHAPRLWREIYAAVEIDGVLLDGFIDLLYELPNGNLVVVDYKTDALHEAEAVDHALDGYRLQAASYALILEQSLKRRVERCVLLFLHPGEEREVTNLDAAMQQVRERLPRDPETIQTTEPR